MSTMEKVVRELAYELWEQAGRPAGRSDEFWFAARYEYERREEMGEIQRGVVCRRAQTRRDELAGDWRLAAYPRLCSVTTGAEGDPRPRSRHARDNEQRCADPRRLSGLLNADRTEPV